MTIQTKHRFVSNKSNSSDLTLIQPSNWNEDHDLVVSGPCIVGKASIGSGLAEEITIGSGLLLNGTTLSVDIPTKLPDVYLLDDTFTNLSVDASVFSNFKVTLTQDHFLENPTSLSEGTILRFIFLQDNIGRRQLSYDTLYRAPNGAAALSSKPLAMDMLTCFYDGTYLMCKIDKGYAIPIAYSPGSMDFGAAEGSGLVAALS